MLVALMVVRNAGWIFQRTFFALRHLVDGIAILNHASTDDTNKQIEFFGKYFSLHLEYESNPEWNERDYRERLLNAGRNMGGTHFAVIDSDEMVVATAIDAIREQAENLNPGECLRLPWIHCWRSFDKYRCDKSAFGTARVPFIFRDAPHLKYEPKADGYQLHCRVPDGLTFKDWGERDKGEGVMHLQHVDWERCRAKQYGYIEQELTRWPGRREESAIREQYMRTLDETGLELRDVPSGWLQ